MFLGVHKENIMTVTFSALDIQKVAVSEHIGSPLIAVSTYMSTVCLQACYPFPQALHMMDTSHMYFSGSLMHAYMDNYSLNNFPVRTMAFPFSLVNYGHPKGMTHETVITETSVYTVDTSPGALGACTVLQGNTLTPETEKFMSHNTFGRLSNIGKVSNIVIAIQY